MRVMTSMKSMKIPAVRKKPAMRAMTSMKAKKKPAVNAKPDYMKYITALSAKDEQLVDLRVALAVEYHKIDRLLEEIMKTRAEAAAAKIKIATLEEEKKRQVAIVPDSGELWVKAGDVVLAIKVVPPFGPAAVDSAKEPHPLNVSSREVGRYSIDDISIIP